jgi:hypothetical protein
LLQPSFCLGRIVHQSWSLAAQHPLQPTYHWGPRHTSRGEGGWPYNEVPVRDAPKGLCDTKRPRTLRPAIRRGIAPPAMTLPHLCLHATSGLCAGGVKGNSGPSRPRVASSSLAANGGGLAARTGTVALPNGGRTVIADHEQGDRPSVAGIARPRYHSTVRHACKGLCYTKRPIRCAPDTLRGMEAGVARMIPHPAAAGAR